MKRTGIWVSVIVAGLAASAQAGGLYLETGGVVVGEGELFSGRVPFAGPENDNWLIVPVEDPGAGPFLNARGGMFVQSLPDQIGGGSGANGPPEVHYGMRITAPGQYRLYVRWDGNRLVGNGGNADSMFMDIVELKDGVGGAIADWYELTGGADGDFATRPWHSDGGFEANAAGVSGAALTWNIASPGDYTLRFTQREDGSAVDAWVFQLASLPAPTDFGPPRSAFIPEPVTVSLMALGAMGLAGYARKRRRRA